MKQIYMLSNLKMSHKFCISEKREEVLKMIDQSIEYFGLNCFFCNICWHCCVTRNLQTQAALKGIKTFNSDIKYWSIDWHKNNHNEYMPTLAYYN